VTTREHDEARGGACEPFIRDAAEHLEQTLAAARPVRDFAAMMARACELEQQGEGEVSDAVEAPSDGLAAVIPLPPRAETDDTDALAPFTAALRAELDSKLLGRSMAGVPPLRTPRRRGRAVAAAAAVAAAVLLLIFGTSQVLRQQDRPDGSAALDEGARPRAGGEADRPGPLTPVVRPVPSPGGEVVEVSHVPEDSAAAPPEQPGPQDMVRERAAARRRPVAAAGPSLEDEALALWQRGELAAAERKYREIVRIAGRSRRAELAWGDLFALVRQIHGADGQAAAWREYLERFPRGRFADDARAGLCQRAAADERAACWRDYLGRHPDGAHRRRAEQALAEAP
jgi:hypothetical protein